MKHTFFLGFVVALSLFAMFAPSSAVYARVNAIGMDAINGPIVSCQPAGCNWCDLYDTIQNFAAFCLSILFFAIAPLLFVYGGLRMIIGGANPGEYEKGKATIWGTVVAILIGIASYAILTWTFSLLGVSGVFQCVPLS